MIEGDQGENTVSLALREATRPFAVESVPRSWMHVATTYSLIIGLLAGAALVPWLPARIVISVLAGLVMARGFILYHDHMHGALLPRSRIARIIFRVYGAISLTPGRSWRKTHNYHHAHVGQIEGPSVGAFPLMTTDAWKKAGSGERFVYRITRHPLTLLSGYVTVFLANVTIMPLLKDPRRHWDSAFSLLAHGALIAGIWWALGIHAVAFAVLVPVTMATALGGYLFYAQHNFRGIRILEPEGWTHDEAALASSSYMQMSKLMAWFTGNIGYHHVHHLNPRIPFYRLPEAMAAIPELQNPAVTSLRPRDVIDCFRLALWDPRRQEIVPLREAFGAAA